MIILFLRELYLCLQSFVNSASIHALQTKCIGFTSTHVDKYIKQPHFYVSNKDGDKVTVDLSPFNRIHHYWFQCITVLLNKHRQQWITWWILFSPSRISERLNQFVAVWGKFILHCTDPTGSRWQNQLKIWFKTWKLFVVTNPSWNYPSTLITVWNSAKWLLSSMICDYFYISCRSLSCQRITLHKNLFFSYVLNSAFTIINLITVVNNPKVVQRSPVSTPHLHNMASLSIPWNTNPYIGVLLSLWGKRFLHLREDQVLDILYLACVRVYASRHFCSARTWISLYFYCVGFSPLLWSFQVLLSMEERINFPHWNVPDDLRAVFQTALLKPLSTVHRCKTV